MTKKIIVVIRPPSDVDDVEEIIKFGRGLHHEAPPMANGVSLTFSAPEYGWIELWLTVNGHTVYWWLADAPDSFASSWRNDTDDESITFKYWLEAIASGRSPALAFDMEGPVGAFLVSGAPAAPIVTFSVVDTPATLQFAVEIDRYVLVRDIYTALIAYWESDVLETAWSHWSKLPKWGLRSAIVEDYLASFGGPHD